MVDRESVAPSYRIGVHQGNHIATLLLLVACATDLLTPFLIWKGILPAEVRWISHVAILGMWASAYVHMMLSDRIPGALWAIAAVSATGIVVALFQEQDFIPTAWGWWIMFQYPVVGLFAYVQPNWPDTFSQRLLTFCISVLGLQVLVQLGQYLTGEIPGDNLAGTFGQHGTANLVIFILLVLCLALGRLITHGQWKPVVVVFALGGASSGLGEMKIFPVAALALGVLAVVLLLFRRGQRWRLVPFVLILGAVVWIFVGFYDLVVAERRGVRRLEAFLEPKTMSAYLGFSAREAEAGRYRYELGRNYALYYGWKEIRHDAATLLFGMGLGARGESRTLGTAGVGLTRGRLGLVTGTSLLVMLQELGLMGIVAIVGFVLWVAWELLRGIREDPQSSVTGLRYGLLLFSLLWPVWLWYTTAWILRVPMLLYWVSLGFVLGESQRRRWEALRVGLGRSNYGLATTPSYE